MLSWHFVFSKQTCSSLVFFLFLRIIVSKMSVTSNTLTQYEKKSYTSFALRLRKLYNCCNHLLKLLTFVILLGHCGDKLKQ